MAVLENEGNNEVFSQEWGQIHFAPFLGNERREYFLYSLNDIENAFSHIFYFVDTIY